MKFSTFEFNKFLPTICSQQTTSHPETWTKENPTYGHCAIISILAQEYFGGEIVKVSLRDTPFENLKSHFFNVIDANEVDFTKQQFGEHFSYQDIPREEQSREEILAHPGTQERYDILKAKLEQRVMSDNLLEQAQEYGQNENIEEWVHLFLLNSGNNVALSDGLAKAPRYWIGPVEYDLSKMIRIGGPEEDKEYPETQESWDIRINRMVNALKAGWKPAPLIAEYKNGELKVRDGGHRFGALEKAGFDKYWTVIWCNNEQDFNELKETI